jgi:hypothetical protein
MYTNINTSNGNTDKCTCHYSHNYWLLHKHDYYINLRTEVHLTQYKSKPTNSTMIFRVNRSTCTQSHTQYDTHSHTQYCTHSHTHYGRTNDAEPTNQVCQTHESPTTKTLNMCWKRSSVTVQMVQHYHTPSDSIPDRHLLFSKQCYIRTDHPEPPRTPSLPRWGACESIFLRILLHRTRFSRSRHWLVSVYVMFYVPVYVWI